MREFILPECSEDNHDNDGKNSDTNCLGFLEYLDETVQERSHPEKPLEECSQHDAPHYSYVNNLEDECKSRISPICPFN